VGLSPKVKGQYCVVASRGTPDAGAGLGGVAGEVAPVVARETSRGDFERENDETDTRLAVVTAPVVALGEGGGGGAASALGAVKTVRGGGVGRWLEPLSVQAASVSEATTTPTTARRLLADTRCAFKPRCCWVRL